MTVQFVSAPARAVIKRCINGQTLCISHSFRVTGRPNPLAFFEPSGEQCGIEAAQEAIASGLLEPSGDALLDARFSQTWKSPR